MMAMPFRPAKVAYGVIKRFKRGWLTRHIAQACKHWAPRLARADLWMIARASRVVN
jgi:hypothetical protein